MDRVVSGRKGLLSARAFAAMCLLGTSAVPLLAQTAPRYSVTELAGVGQQINNSGQIAGWVTVGGSAHAAIYSNGAWRDLGIPAGDQLSTLFGINNAGAAVGFSFASLPPPPDPTDNRWTAIWAPAGATAVQPLSLISPDSFAYAINDSGAIVGCRNNYADNPPDPNRAFLVASGTVTDLHALLATLPDDFSCAHDINNAGVVVGEFTPTGGLTRGFVYRNGATTILMQSGTSRHLSIGRAINTAGKVIGDGGLTATAADQATTYDTGTGVYASVGVEALGALGSMGNDINTRGDVVGSMTLNVGQHAFLATGGHVYDLNDLLPAGGDVVLQQAVSINDGGQIVASGALATDPPGTLRYYLLDASAPAPSIDGLIAQVQALEAGHFLSHGSATSLIAQLTNAKRHLSAHCTRLAVQSLETFVNLVDTLIRTGRLSPSKGQPLIDAANRIIDNLVTRH
jgi:probable HAF family extracellular repeat protein